MPALWATKASSHMIAVMVSGVLPYHWGREIAFESESSS